MYDELEWLLILIAAAVGVGIIGGTLLRGPRDLAPFDRYGCLPGLGLGGLGVVGTTFGLPLLDPGVEPLGGLLLGGASMSTGLAVGYGFSKTDLGLGEKGSYVLGAGG
jgi:hypothetical protein